MKVNLAKDILSSKFGQIYLQQRFFFSFGSAIAVLRSWRCVGTILARKHHFWHIEKACGLQTLQSTCKNQKIGKICPQRVCKERNSW